MYIRRAREAGSSRGNEPTIKDRGVHTDVHTTWKTLPLKDPISATLPLSKIRLAGLSLLLYGCKRKRKSVT